jgi:hypothetical protein
MGSTIATGNVNHSHLCYLEGQQLLLYLLLVDGPAPLLAAGVVDSPALGLRELVAVLLVANTLDHGKLLKGL